MRREPKTRAAGGRGGGGYATCYLMCALCIWGFRPLSLALSAATHQTKAALPSTHANRQRAPRLAGWKLAALLTFGCKRQERSPFRSTLARGTRAASAERQRQKHRPAVSQPRAFALDALLPLFSLHSATAVLSLLYRVPASAQPCQAGAAAGAVPTRSTRHDGLATVKVS